MVAGTICGHKTAVLMTIERAVGRVLRTDENIKLYIKGLCSSVPLRTRLPDWNLALILEALMEPPFEPLASCDVKFLTLKMVFLVAFATAARRSEIHAISKDFVRDD